MITARRLNASWVSVPGVGKRLIKFASESKTEALHRSTELSAILSAKHIVVIVESPQSFDTYAVVRMTRQEQYSAYHSPRKETP